MNEHLVVAAAFCILASVYDLRERRIPNALNYGGLIAAIAFGAAAGAGLQFVLLVAGSFVFAYLLYRIGAWAGGDAKFFTALAAFLAVNRADVFLPFELFLLSALFLVPVSIALFASLVVGRWRELRDAVKSDLRPAFESALLAPAILSVLSLWPSPLAMFILLAVLSFIRIPLFLGVMAFGVSAWFLGANAFAVTAFSFAAILVIGLLKASFGLLQQHAFRSTVVVGRLAPGDVPAEFIVAVGDSARVVAGPSLRNAISLVSSGHVADALLALRPPARFIAGPNRAAGFSSSQIAELKRRGVKQVVVRRTLPFAPILVAGFAASAAGVLPWLLGVR